METLDIEDSPRLQELQQQRARLAFEAQTDKAAEKELVKVERELANLLRDIERAALIEQEAERRAEEAWAREKEAARVQALADLKTLLSERAALGERIESSLDDILVAASEYVQMGRHANALGIKAGRPQNSTLGSADALHKRISHKLSFAIPNYFEKFSKTSNAAVPLHEIDNNQLSALEGVN